MSKNRIQLKYGDEHKVFLQGIISRGIMNSGEVMDMFCLACNRCGGKKAIKISNYHHNRKYMKCYYLVELPEVQAERNEKLKNFIICINQEIRDLGLEIKKAIDEDSRFDLITDPIIFVIFNEVILRFSESSLPSLFCATRLTDQVLDYKLESLLKLTSPRTSWNSWGSS